MKEYVCEQCEVRFRHLYLWLRHVRGEMQKEIEQMESKGYEHDDVINNKKLRTAHLNIYNSYLESQKKGKSSIS